MLDGEQLGKLLDVLDGFEEHSALALKGLMLEEFRNMRNADGLLPLYRFAYEAKLMSSASPKNAE